MASHERQACQNTCDPTNRSKAASLALCELVDDPQRDSNAKNFTICHEAAFMYGTGPNSLIGACSWNQWQGQCAMLFPWIHENIHHIEMYRNSRIQNPHPSTICNVNDVPVNKGINAWWQHHKSLKAAAWEHPEGITLIVWLFYHTFGCGIQLFQELPLTWLVVPREITGTQFEDFLV